MVVAGMTLHGSVDGGRGGQGCGRGRSRGRPNYGNNVGPYGFYSSQPWNNQFQLWNSFNQPWNAPPCPYPTTPGHRIPSQSSGILGAPPPPQLLMLHQSHHTLQPS